MIIALKKGLELIGVHLSSIMKCYVKKQGDYSFNGVRVKDILMNQQFGNATRSNYLELMRTY